MQINKELLKNITLLYVEDDEMTLEEISYFLSKYVKKLIVAKNGIEGLELFKEHKPDMIISDIQMPKMDGLEMSRKILEIDSEVPIALTTAYSDGEYIMESIEMGIDKYILKPVNLSEILIVIQKSLNLISSKNEYYEEYIQFILDSNNTFMFIVNSDKIEYVNENLTNLLNKDNIEILDKNFEKYKTLFELEDIQTEDNYVDYIMKNPENEYVVTFNKYDCKNFYNRKFNVKYKYFKSMDKSVFVFTELETSKLKVINEISSELINNLDECKNKNLLIDNLNKIIKLTSKS